jgi:[ribosomal protein S18]-alanine N-acetyltransferase
MLRLLNEIDYPQLLIIEKLTQLAPWTLETFERCMSMGYKGWVIEQDQQVAGFIILAMQVGEAHIMNLCVHPNFQRRGFGRQLIEHVLQKAREKHAHIVFLEVRRSNHPAIMLYEQMGFMQISERKGYYATAKGREDALVFAKDLTVQ